MGIDKNLMILIPSSILIGPALRLTSIAKQHIKDFTFIQIHFKLCGEMFMHAGFPLCCDQFWGRYSKKVIYYTELVS